jgi:hypothetical protein
MTRAYRVALLVPACVAVLLVSYAGWTRFRSPASAADEDAYAVWIALLKGFSGDVVYVGSDDTFAYFRLGHFFWSYYKVRACAADLPETFRVGGDGRYVVQLQAQQGRIRHFVGKCAEPEGYYTFALERK